MTQLDPRLYAYREDLAAASLKDKVRAPRYSEGETRQVCASSAEFWVSRRGSRPRWRQRRCPANS